MKTGSTPLVSCIMPTRNRNRFIPNAIRYFKRQTYPNKELVIVDDGPNPVSDLIPDDPEIRYIYLRKRITLGEKRNFCVQKSKADLIMHWDDDDWMRSDRIEYQVNQLLENEVAVCGVQNMYFCELDSGNCFLYKYPPNAKPWLAGGSLLYTREFWKRNPFPNVQVASDTTFIFSRKLKSYKVLEDYAFYVAAIHPNNTSQKKTNTSVWTKIDTDPVKQFMKEDWEAFLRPEIIVPVLRPAPETKRKKPFVIQRKEVKVSACLLSYKRPGNMQLIVNQLHGLSFVDEIIVWNNNTELQLELVGDKVKVINSTENRICYGRFLCAKAARNELIYVQDDDAIPKDIEGMYQRFLEDQTGIVHGLYSNHYKLRERYYHFYGQVALLGWGAFFKKSWVEVLDQFLAANPEDYLFRREADQIFTLLTRRKHSPVPVKLQLLPSHSTPGIALYQESDHNLFKALAVQRCLKINRKNREFEFPVTWNVVIPCRNYGRYLKEAVMSVLKNAVDLVVTIVDDASTDNTQEVGEELAKKFDCVSYYRLPKNMGVSYARNYGIAKVHSLFVIMLDADDKIGLFYLFQSEKLLRQGTDIVNPDAHLFGKQKAIWKVPERVTLSMLKKKNYVHTCAAFKRDYWVMVGGVDEQMPNWQDYEFWIRLSKAGARIVRLSGSHFYYRKHGISKSTDSNGKKKEINSYLRRKHADLFT